MWDLFPGPRAPQPNALTNDQQDNRHWVMITDIVRIEEVFPPTLCSLSTKAMFSEH